MLLFTICAVTLCGCGLNEKPVSLGSSMEIPDDGIVSASVFERLQEDNKVMTFFGQSGDTYYEWTVFGNDIETPQDTNMKLEVKKDEDEFFTLAAGAVFRHCRNSCRPRGTSSIAGGGEQSRE